MPNLEKLDILAFCVALVAAPILVAVLGFAVLAPIYALHHGLPTYLTFGAVAFLIFICFHLDHPLWFALAGVLAHVASRPALNAFADDPDFVFGAGLIFAPLWGLVFGTVYTYLRRKFDEPMR